MISDSYYEHWDGSETFTATFFAYIFGNSISGDFVVNMSEDLWSAVMWFMQLVRSAQEGQTTLEGKEFSLNFPKNLPNMKKITALHFFVLQFWKRSSPCFLRHASHVIDFPRFSNQGPLQGASLRQSRFGLTVEAHGAMSRKWVLRLMAGL